MTKLAAVFDLDGTLLDTIDDLAYAVNTALTENGFPTHPREAYFYFVGNGARTLVQRALPQDVEKTVFETVYARYSELYEAHWNVFTKPYDGILDLLAALRADGIPLGVVSNKVHDRTLEVIDTFFPNTFDAVFGNRPGVPLKPDPAGVFDALAALGSDPAHAFYLGDTGVDIETGKRAGIYSAGALWGFRTAEELTAAGADILCAAPSDALAAARALFAKLK
ncbi:MAG: HAD family hydrolase [Clostridiaceae bacterium]|nr:HAD family hydrolase [Clostridiaceae bacterium]